MGFDRLKFSKDWNSTTDFPTVETSETQVRADMQLLHDESKSALNALMEALEKGGRDALVRFASDEVKFLRLNQYGGLEVSSDGVNYSVVTAGTEGGAAPAIHASQHATGGSDPITPEQIGALPRDGSAAMTGMLKLIDTNTDGLTEVGISDNYSFLRSYHDANDRGTYRMLQLFGKDATLADCFRLFLAENDTAVGSYNILHSGNYYHYALPRDGSVPMTSALVIARVQNGYSMVDKNHDANGDYGTDIRDYDSAGKPVSVKVFSAQNTVGFVDRDGVLNNILHTGNVGSILGASKIVTGTYTGDGSTSRTINLGFTPSMVVLSGTCSGYLTGYIAMESGKAVYTATVTPETPLNYTYNGKTISVLKIVSGGFAVSAGVSIDYSGGDWVSHSNVDGKIFNYVAIG